LFTDNGMVTFMSSAFHHDTEGEYVVEKNGMKFVNYHENIYQLNEGEAALVLNEKGDAVNASKPWNFSITKNVAAMFLTVILMLLFFFSLANYHKKNKDRKSTRLNSSHVKISYAVFCLKKKMI